jgi:hypothetical protein
MQNEHQTKGTRCPVAKNSGIRGTPFASPRKKDSPAFVNRDSPQQSTFFGGITRGIFGTFYDLCGAVKVQDADRAASKDQS